MFEAIGNDDFKITLKLTVNTSSVGIGYVSNITFKVFWNLFITVKRTPLCLYSIYI